MSAIMKIIFKKMQLLNINMITIDSHKYNKTIAKNLNIIISYFRKLDEPILKSWNDYSKEI